MTDKKEPAAAVKIQPLSLFKWVTTKLQGQKEIKIERLSEFQDGSSFLHLVSFLFDTPIKPEDKNAPKELQMRSALRYLRSIGFPFPLSETAEDLMHGNEPTILEVIWFLISKIEIEPISYSGLSGTQALMAWCRDNARSYPNCPEISDFDSSWADGIAITALVHGIKPDIVHIENLLQNPPIIRWQSILSLIEATYKIPAFFDPQNIIRSPEPKTLISYLAILHHAAKTPSTDLSPPKSQPLETKTNLGFGFGISKKKKGNSSSNHSSSSSTGISPRDYRTPIGSNSNLESVLKPPGAPNPLHRSVKKKTFGFIAKNDKSRGGSASSDESTDLKVSSDADIVPHVPNDKPDILIEKGKTSKKGKFPFNFQIKSNINNPPGSTKKALPIQKVKVKDFAYSFGFGGQIQNRPLQPVLDLNLKPSSKFGFQRFQKTPRGDVSSISSRSSLSEISLTPAGIPLETPNDPKSSNPKFNFGIGPQTTRHRTSSSTSISTEEPSLRHSGPSRFFIKKNPGSLPSKSLGFESLDPKILGSLNLEELEILFLEEGKKLVLWIKEKQAEVIKETDSEPIASLTALQAEISNTKQVASNLKLILNHLISLGTPAAKTLYEALNTRFESTKKAWKGLIELYKDQLLASFELEKV